MPNPVTTQPPGSEASNLADRAADSAASAIRSTQSAATSAFDRLSDKADSAREYAVPLIDRLSSHAEAAARRGAEAVKETSAQMRERALRAQDSTLGYVRDEPLRAMLIAAATGAALMALLGLAYRSRRD